MFIRSPQPARVRTNRRSVRVLAAPARAPKMYRLPLDLTPPNTEHHRFDAAAFAAGGSACKLRMLGMGADSGVVGAWTCDHIRAVINGGPNRESNLHSLCEWCESPNQTPPSYRRGRVSRRRKHGSR
jgi:HNH endonuclease